MQSRMKTLFGILTTVAIQIYGTNAFTAPQKAVVTTEEGNTILCYCEEVVSDAQRIQEIKDTPCGEACKIKLPGNRGKDKSGGFTYRAYGFSSTSSAALPGYCDWKTEIKTQQLDQLPEWEKKLIDDFCKITRDKGRTTTYKFKKLEL